MLRTARTRVAVLIASCIALTAVPSSAFAMLAGAESPAELTNSTASTTLQNTTLDQMAKMGAQIVRINWQWNATAVDCSGQSLSQLADPNNACYNWRSLDNVVRGANDRGMRVLASVVLIPAWVNHPPASGGANCKRGYEPARYMGASDQQFQSIADNYAAFYAAMGKRYAPGGAHGTIAFYTIANEPNSCFYWAPKPDPKRYAQLYVKAAVALKTANPAALVAPGPLGPDGGSGGMKPKPFLAQFQKSALTLLPGSLAQKRSYINAVAQNPYPANTSQPSVAVGKLDPNRYTMARIDQLFKQLDSSPLTRGTKVWATEFGWETYPGDIIFGISQAQQAQFIAEAFDWLDSKKRVTMGINYGFVDPTAQDDWQSGMTLPNGTPKLSFTMFQRMVSVPRAGTRSRVRRGTLVRVWGRSNIAPKSGVLAFNSGGTTWRIMPGQKRKADGSITATYLITKPTKFAVYDTGNAMRGVKPGYGLARTITVS